MPDPLPAALVAGVLCLPLVISVLPVLVGAQIGEPLIRERDALPAFDARPLPGEQEVAMTPALWRARGRTQSECGLTTAWPESVERRLKEHIAALKHSEAEVATTGEPGGDDVWPADMLGFRTVLPGGIEVYAVEHLWVPTGHGGLTIVLRDSATGIISTRPLTLVQKWSSTGDDGPTAWWADLEGDGSLELGVERSYHNGTVENGKFVRWFRVTQEVELELVHVAPLLDEVRGVSRGEDGVIRSRLLRSAEGELIHDQWFENPAYGLAPRALGRQPVGRTAERRRYE